MFVRLFFKISALGLFQEPMGSWFIRNILKFRRFQPRYSYKIIYIHILFFIHFLFRTHKQLQSQNGLPHSTLSATPSAVARFLVLLQ